MAITLIVEDGTGVEGANTYMSLEDADEAAANTAYAESWDELEDEAKKLYLLVFTEMLDNRFRYYGKILFDTQSLQWPRTKNYDDKGRIIPPGTIPPQLIGALLYLILLASTDEDLVKEPDTIDRMGDIKSWSTDGLAVNFGSSQSSGTATAKERQENIDRYNAQFVPLFETRYPDLEVRLRSIGELKYEDWVTTNRQTVVK